MDFRIPIHFTCRSLKNPGTQTFCQTKHIDRPVHTGFSGLHGIVLVMNRGGGASQVIYFVHLNIQRKSDIVAQKLKSWIAEQMLDIALVAGEVIVDTQDIMPVVQ